MNERFNSKSFESEIGTRITTRNNEVPISPIEISNTNNCENCEKVRNWIKNNPVGTFVIGFIIFRIIFR